MRCVTSIVIVLACATGLKAAQWTHHTDFTDATAMLSLDGLILGASTRGAFQYDPEHDEWQHWSLMDGLVSISQRDIASDDAGHVFWLGEDGSLSAWTPATGEWSRGNLEYRDNEDITEVHTIWGGNGQLIVSHSTGLSVLEYNEADDEYLVLSNLHRIGSGSSHAPVYAAALCAGKSLAVSANGVYYADSWSTTIEDWSTPFLPAGASSIAEAEIINLREDNQDLAVIRLLDQDDGGALLLFDGEQLQVVADYGSSWKSMSSLCEGDESGPYWVALRDTAVNSSSQTLMYGYRAGNIWQEFDRSVFARPLASACLMPGGDTPDPWVMISPSSYQGGLSNRSAADPDHVYSPNLPGAEEFVDLALGPDGSLWAVGVAENTARSGVFQFHDEEWRTWRFTGEYLGDYPTCIQPDRNGGFWMGTWGRGAVRVDIESGERQWFRGDTDAQHKLYGFRTGNDSTFVLVTDLLEDDNGNMWIVNHRAHNDSCIVAVPAEWYEDQDQPFYRFHYYQGNETEGSYPAWLASERPGSIWAGVGGKESHDTSKRLLRLYDVFADVSQLSTWDADTLQLADVAYNYGLGQSAGLINDIAVDNENGIWVSTNTGVYYGGVYSGYIQFSRLQFIAGQISENVDCMGVDARNRVWLGSSLGLNVYLQQDVIFDEPAIAEDFNQMIRNQESLRVNRILVDNNTGCLWVATNYGLFRCEGGVTNYGSSPSSETLRVYPNPFRPGDVGVSGADNRMRILPESLANDARVAIYDLNGVFVRDFTLREIEDGWDGRNESGGLVAPGVYLVLANGGGTSARGKVVVIR